ERASRDEPDRDARESERLGDRSAEDNQRKKIFEARLGQLAVHELVRGDASGRTGEDSAPQDRPRARRADPDGGEKRKKRAARRRYGLYVEERRSGSDERKEDDVTDGHDLPYADDG